MQNFIEKWKNEPKFKTKIQLALYTLFVIVVAVFAVSTRSNIPTNTTSFESEEENIVDKTESNFSITISNKYNYIKNITINNKQYQYTGYINEEQETINKVLLEETIKIIISKKKKS